MTPVKGHCPACGHPSLFVNEENWLACSQADCPQANAASVILCDSEIEHIVRLDAENWTVRHPLRERLGDALMDCSLNEYLHNIDRPDELGTFRARREDDREWEVWSWERIT